MAALRISIVLLLHGFFLLGGNSLVAQDCLFDKRYQVSVSWSGSDNIIPFNNGYVVCGVANNTLLAYDNTLALVQFDSCGELQFQKLYYKPFYDYYGSMPGGLIRTSSGMLAQAGSVTDSAGDKSGYFTKFNFALDTVGFRLLDDTSYDCVLYRIKETRDKGFIMIGFSKSTGSTNFVLIKSDTSGSEVWRKEYGIAGLTEIGGSVDTTEDGGYILGGFRRFTVNNRDSWVIKTDSLGNIEWQRIFSNELSADVISLPGKEYLVATNYLDSSQSWMDFLRPYLLKLDSAGNILWEQKYGESRFSNYIGNLTSSPDHKWLIAGTCNDSVSTVGTHLVGYIRCIDTSGTELWYRQYNKVQGPYSVNYLNNARQYGNHIIACGFVQPLAPDTGQQDFWIMKLDSFGCLDSPCDAVGINEPVQYNESVSVYPNPSTGQVSFSFARKVDGRIYLYNAQGQIVHTERIEGTNLATITMEVPGIYFYVIEEPQGPGAKGKIIIQK